MYKDVRRSLRGPNENELRVPTPHTAPSSSSDPISSPVHLSQPSSRQPSRTPSPFAVLPRDPPQASGGADAGGRAEPAREDDSDSDLGFEDWNDDHSDADEELADMPSDLRPSLHRPTDGRSEQPLLKHDEAHHDYDSPPSRPTLSRRSTFHERDPVDAAHAATKAKYTYAAGFLVLSLISFTVQTETAVYIQSQLHWEKPYCMLYLTHGSWSLLWPTQLLILRLSKWKMPWKPFWRRHVQILRQTAQMVRFQTLHPSARQSHDSPVPFIIRTTAFVTSALTVAGGSWYVAVNLTTASDLTAIYNCSAFFAYAFSIPLLHEKVRLSKVMAVGVAIVGVLVVAYGDTATPKHGSKSGGGTGGPPPEEGHPEPKNRFLGNVIIGIGSVLYGFYEVLYKKVACPPDGCSPGRGMIFANTFGSLIGCFTLTVLWIPLPILHWLGWEEFQLPRGEQAWVMLISVLANATFSGSFLVLISLTSPVLSSVAALLTIFIVALVDVLLPPPLNSPLTPAAITGGILIIVAFIVLSVATYREMDEEKRKKLEEGGSSDESDIED